MKTSKPRVFLALDVHDKVEAFKLAKTWAPHVAGLKVGPRLGFQLSQAEWNELAGLAELFIDYKFFDIPSTVESSVERAFESGASFCTVHAMNGLECLTRLSALEENLNKIRPFKILSVTLLTSFDQKENALPLVQEKDSSLIVKKLTDIVVESGLTGLVCSAQEVEFLKAKNHKAFLVTPGIRFEEDGLDDQKRVVTPLKAWRSGSDYLVMGRSLLRAVDLKSTAEKLRDQWQAVQ